jgi:alkanesulfonate monooxygenase SsuD/methylene tetrahydromethanopterin reductase-like flavin-dependent oxidoreductase (luciferase family)
VRLAQRAHAGGFQQIWANDNLGQRNIFTVLAAIAVRVPVRVGTSIVVPYFRNPVDIAGSLAALSELTAGRELSVGIARGEAGRAGEQIEMPNPVAMVRETTLALRALLNDATIRFSDYPAPAAIHHVQTDREVRLGFSPAAPVRFYCGGHGPRILKFAGAAMDGIYFGDHFIPVARAQRLPDLLKPARSTADASGRTLFDICELDISVAKDRRHALNFARPFAANILIHLEDMGFKADDYRALGLEPQLIASLHEACRGGASVNEAADLLSDDAVKSCFIAGSPEECRDQLAEIASQAERLGFRQIALAKLGSDWAEAIGLLCSRVL